jgi:predicted RNA-binding protein YlqC (UPF0109 family)
LSERSQSSASGRVPAPRAELSSLGLLVKSVLQALVDHPEAVAVSEWEGEQTTVIEVRVGPGDFGKVLGKQGRTAKALRTLLNAAATKLRKRAVLELIE